MAASLAYSFASAAARVNGAPVSLSQAARRTSIRAASSSVFTSASENRMAWNDESGAPN